MTDLPSGTVTFLLTDVEASTAMWGADASEMDESMSRLNETITAHVVTNGGSVLKARGEGDSHFAVFDRASAAIAAAYGFQVALQTEGPVVRAAVHTGEAVPRDGDYQGVAPSRTARLRAAAHGGQILVSRVSADLAAPELPSGVSLVSLGSFRLRDWPGPEVIFGVDGPGLRSDFASPRVLGDAQRPVMTVVFVDIVGWSKRIEGLNDPELVGKHRELARVIRDSFAEHSGSFLKLMGDGAIAAFDDPTAAIAFAQSACRSDFQMRAGVHAGMVELIADDIVGRALYRAAELVRRASAGQVLTTRTVADLVSGHDIGLAPGPDGDVYLLA